MRVKSSEYERDKSARETRKARNIYTYRHGRDLALRGGGRECG